VKGKSRGRAEEEEEGECSEVRVRDNGDGRHAEN
jgi:hypothetical protein